MSGRTLSARRRPMDARRLAGPSSCYVPITQRGRARLALPALHLPAALRQQLRWWRQVWLPAMLARWWR